MSKRDLKFLKSSLPLKQDKKKALSIKPDKPDIFVGLGSPLKPKPYISDSQDRPVDLNLRLGLAAKEASANGNKIKQNQKKMSQAFSTSPKGTTSTTSTTTPDTTSPGSSTSSTTPASTTYNKTPKPETTMGRKSYNKNSGEDRGYSKPSTIGFNGDDVSGTDLFRNANDDGSNVGQLYGDGAPSKVDFNLQLPCTSYLNDFETSIIGGSEVRPKLILRATSFSTAIANAKNSPTNNADYNLSLNLIFKKFDSDVGNTLNSYTAPSWSFNTFCDGLTDICKALEYYYFLDAVLAYDQGSMGTDNINRCYTQYKGLFTNSQVLIANRAQLRSLLKGCWFPTNFAQLIRYFYQAYKVNPLQQSTAYRYIPDKAFFVSDTTQDTLLTTPDLTSIINNLKPGTNAAKLSTILNRVYPKGRILSLPKSCSDITYDVLMTEITANEPYGFTNSLDSNSQGVYPISYQTQANDLPYYMDADPNAKLNGLCYALQSVATNKTTTSGYVPTYYTGIREPIFTSIKDSSALVNKTNIQIVTNEYGQLFGKAPNLTTVKSIVDTYQANTVVFSNTDVAGTQVMCVRSQAPANMQRVYFNNFNGPRLLMNELINGLFMTRA